MPIIRTYGDAAAVGQVAYDVGEQQGETQARQRQQQLDARLVLQAMEHAHQARMNAGPSFAERSRMQDARAGLRGPRPEGVRSYRQAVREGDPSSSPLERLRSIREKRRIEQADRQQKQTLLEALDQQVPPDARGLDYEIAKQSILSGEKPTDAVLRSVRPKQDAEEGQPEAAEFRPSTAFGKSVDQRIRSGKVDELVGVFSQREKPDTLTSDQPGPLTARALEARATLDSWARSPTTSDADLASAVQKMRDAQSDPAATRILEEELDRRDELRREVQCPMVLDQARTVAADRAAKMAAKQGRNVTAGEFRRILGSALQEQAEALEIDAQDYRSWMARQQEQENVARAARREQQAIEEQQMQRALEQQAAENERSRGGGQEPRGSDNRQRSEQRQQARPVSGQRGF